MSEQFFKDWLASWTGNKPEKLLEFYHDDIFYLDPFYPQGIKGKEALGNYLGKLLAKNPDWVWELVEFQKDQQTYLVKWKATIPGKGNVTGHDIVGFCNGKIAVNEVYFDLPLRSNP
jgi:hypothetical protein